MNRCRLGRVDEYANWVRDLDFVEVTDSELDNATFESAEKQHLENKTDAAIRGYTNYIKDFPNGTNVLKANFKLAQLYFGKEDKKDKKLRFDFEFSALPISSFGRAKACEMFQARQNLIAKFTVHWFKRVPGTIDKNSYRYAIAGVVQQDLFSPFELGFVDQVLGFGKRGLAGANQIGLPCVAVFSSRREIHLDTFILRQRLDWRCFAGLVAQLSFERRTGF